VQYQRKQRPAIEIQKWKCFTHRNAKSRRVAKSFGSIKLKSMNLTEPILLLAGLSGIIFIIAGWVMWKFPPQKINNLYGYRTSASMKSQENWDYAQKLSTKIMIWGGIGMFLCSFGIYFLKLSYETQLIIGLSSLVL